MDNVNMELLQCLNVTMNVVNDLRASAEQKLSTQFDVLFAQTGSEQTVEVQTGNVMSGQKEDASAKSFYEKESSRSIDTKITDSNKQDSGIDAEMASEAVECIEDAAGQIKVKLMDLFDISEEELEDIMEALGITNVDLFRVSNLVQVIAEATEGFDGVSLLVNEQFVELTNAVSEISGELVEQLNIVTDETPAALTDFYAELMTQMTRVTQTTQDAQMTQIDESDSILTEEIQQMLNPTENLQEAAVASENVISSLPASERGSEVTSNEPMVNVAATVESEDLSTNGTAQMQSAEEEDSEESLNQNQQMAEITTEKASDSAEEVSKTAFTVTKDIHGFGTEKKDIENSNGPVVQTTTQTTYTMDVSSGQVVTETVTSYVDAQKTMDLISQITRQASITITEDVTSMEMQLSPASLGSITLNIASKAGMISAQITAENEAVKQALQAQIEVLRENLNEQGLKVESIEVTVASHEFERNLEQNAHSEEQRQNSEQKASGRRSLHMDGLDGLQGLMSEEEALIAKMMAEQGNTMDVTA